LTVLVSAAYPGDGLGVDDCAGGELLGADAALVTGGCATTGIGGGGGATSWTIGACASALVRPCTTAELGKLDAPVTDGRGASVEYTLLVTGGPFRWMIV
jgi:hypothetical protein